MPTPYNLAIHNSCADCTVRQDHMFCNMSQPSLQAMDAVKFTSVYPKGSVLFVEGEAPRGVFVICSGRVKLTTSSSQGRILIVKVAEPGEVLGVSGAILGRPYELSAETIEPAQLNFIRRAAAEREISLCAARDPLSRTVADHRRETGPPRPRLVRAQRRRNPARHPRAGFAHPRRDRADDRHHPRDCNAAPERLAPQKDDRDQRIESLRSRSRSAQRHGQCLTNRTVSCASCHS